MAKCTCNIAGAFPGLGGQGIISANLKSNTQIIITSDKQILIGPTVGQLSITGYGDGKYSCPGRAGVSYEWMQRYDCMNDTLHMIPRGGDRSYIEGDVGSISIVGLVSYTGFSASVGGGPHSVYLSSSHEDGYGFSYNGPPIAVTGRNTSAGIVGNLIDGEVYLTNFTWEQQPPNLPTASYSFLVVGKG